jgi:hypothetical protein
MERLTNPRDVFINCPFDDGYGEFFLALIFTIARCGFVPRCALETDDGAENRFAKIQTIIEECRYGIHDISRTEVDGDPPLPRFNMPLELGLFLGAKRFGGAPQKEKRCLILDREAYRYQRFISDIAGQDIHSHGGTLTGCIQEVSGWLRGCAPAGERHRLPGGRRIEDEFHTFRGNLPAICANRHIAANELTFGDKCTFVAAYLSEA